jgi:hypothetical protein
VIPQNPRMALMVSDGIFFVALVAAFFLLYPVG